MRVSSDRCVSETGGRPASASAFCRSRSAWRSATTALMRVTTSDWPARLRGAMRRSTPRPGTPPPLPPWRTAAAVSIDISPKYPPASKIANSRPDDSTTRTGRGGRRTSIRRLSLANEFFSPLPYKRSDRPRGQLIPLFAGQRRKQRVRPARTPLIRLRLSAPRRARSLPASGSRSASERDLVAMPAQRVVRSRTAPGRRARPFRA